MEILFLVLTCFFFAIQYIPNKLYQVNSDGSVNASMYRGFFGIVFSLTYLFITSGFGMEIGKKTTIIALLFVASTVMSATAFLVGLACGKLSTLVFFSLCGGMILPVIYGFLFLDEAITLPKTIGIIVIVGAMIPNFISDGKKEVAKDKNSGEKKSGGKNALFLLCCMGQFFGNGFVSIFTKMQSNFGDVSDNNDFLKLVKLILFLTYGGSVVVIALIKKKKDTTGSGIIKLSLSSVVKTVNFKCVLIAFVMCGLSEITNTIGNVFSLKCAETMDATIQFPIISAAVILTTAIYSSFIFGEKPKAKDIISLVLSTIGIVVTMIP